MLISTGLDLELWLPTIVDKSGNDIVRSGQIGYMSASQGLNLLEKPVVMSRAEGGVHIHGNPHITCSPVNMRVAARNITTGLIKNDPDGKEYYEVNLDKFLNDLDKRLFGQELVNILGGQTLSDMAKKGKLIPFLEKQEYQGAVLIDLLDGWMKAMHPLRGTPIVTYHKNWVYFLNLFGLEEAGTIEPKPGIPPSAKHVTGLIEMMQTRDIRIILAANYFDKQKIHTVAKKVNAGTVIVPLYVGGEQGIENYFQLIDHWVNNLLAAWESGRG